MKIESKEDGYGRNYVEGREAHRPPEILKPPSNVRKVITPSILVPQESYVVFYIGLPAMQIF